MRYWDASAIVPLLVEETRSDLCAKLLTSDPHIATWWLSLIECSSALNRIWRQSAIDDSEIRTALDALESLSDGWIEVRPTESVRLTAMRMLRAHNLRAADSLQLAAATVLSGEDRRQTEFVCFDNRLLGAADREGFRIVLPD